MDRMFNLNDLTKAQRRIIEEKDKNEIRFYKGMGKTTGIFTVACCYAEGNSNLNIAIVSKDINDYLDLIELAKKRYMIDVYMGEDYCKITFPKNNSDEDSVIIISKFDMYTIYTPDIERRPYGDIRFIYDFIYFDDVQVDFISINDFEYGLNLEKITYLSQEVKQNLLFVYTPGFGGCSCYD